MSEYKKEPQSAKLLVLMDEFEALMKKHDLGGAIVLHHKDEVFFKLFMTPTYSMAEAVHDRDSQVVSYHFKTKGLPQDIKEEKIKLTCNLFHSVSYTLMDIGYNLGGISEQLDMAAGTTYSDPDE